MSWLPEHDAALLDLYPRGELTQHDIAVALNSRFGTEYTFHHISKRAASLGLPKRGRPYEPPYRRNERAWT